MWLQLRNRALGASIGLLMHRGSVTEFSDALTEVRKNFAVPRRLSVKDVNHLFGSLDRSFTSRHGLAPAHAARLRKGKTRTYPPRPSGCLWPRPFGSLC